MNALFQQLQFSGSTSRRTYWLAVLAGLAVAAVAVLNRDALPQPVPVVVLAAVQLALVIATLRRLNDAGFSRWWILFALFPMNIAWDLFHVSVGSSQWQFFDMTMLIRSIPVLIALIAPAVSSDATVRGSVGTA
jgi:uncharacterized membrane protein YhaH (DUF805 family)